MSTRKAKLEASILTKAKRFTEKESSTTTPAARPVVIPTKRSHPNNDDASSPPSKVRKPRHATVEGQRFIKEKEKARLREWEGSSLQQPSTKSAPTSSSDTKNKKNKNKKKKKKGKKVKTTATGEEKISESTPSEGGGDERYRRDALAYLQLWKGHRDHWKFNKLKQVWLLKHAVDSSSVDDTCFESLLEYVGSIQGVARDKTRTEMESCMADFESKFGTGQANSVFSRGTSKEGATEGDKKGYERARQVIQMLSE